PAPAPASKRSRRVCLFMILSSLRDYRRKDTATAAKEKWSRIGRAFGASLPCVVPIFNYPAAHGGRDGAIKTRTAQSPHKFFRMPCRLGGTMFVLGSGLATIWLSAGARAGGKYRLQSGTSVAFRAGRRHKTMGHLKGSAVMSAAATTSNTIRLHRVL